MCGPRLDRTNERPATEHHASTRDVKWLCAISRHEFSHVAISDAFGPTALWFQNLHSSFSFNRGHCANQLLRVSRRDSEDKEQYRYDEYCAVWSNKSSDRNFMLDCTAAVFKASCRPRVYLDAQSPCSDAGSSLLHATIPFYWLTDLRALAFPYSPVPCCTTPRAPSTRGMP